jgi:hypothetical protein
LGQKSKRKTTTITPPSSYVNYLRWWFDIVYLQKCVVGEEYDFPRGSTYNCEGCGKIRAKFSLYFAHNLLSKLENKQRFVNH